jgi:hypothetical protein
MAVLLLPQVPPPASLRVMLDPIQSALLPVIVPAVVIIVTALLAAQPVLNV